MTQRAALAKFLALYGAMFAAFGVASPFLPALLQQDGLKPGELGIVLASGTGIRLLTGPLGGRLADRLGRARLVLFGFAAASAVVATGYSVARGLVFLLLVSIAHASVLAPLTPLSDALALGSARAPGGFQYGWVRGAGSAAFIAGTLLSGQLVGAHGLGLIIWLNAGLLAVAAAAVLLVPNRVSGTADDAKGSVRDLLRLPSFLRLMAVAALVGGSQAMHDGFGVIRWRSAGLSDSACSVLWSLSVASEVGVFLLAGPWLLRRLGPANTLTLSAAAGVLRWGIEAQTAWFPAVALAEPLQGLTFALMHLSVMDLIGRSVPQRLAATAQAFYATVAMGAVSVCVSLASGPLYGAVGAPAFWAMAALCAAAVPVAAGLRRGGGETARTAVASAPR